MHNGRGLIVLRYGMIRFLVLIPHMRFHSLERSIPHARLAIRLPNVAWRMSLAVCYPPLFGQDGLFQLFHSTGIRPNRNANTPLGSSKASVCRSSGLHMSPPLQTSNLASDDVGASFNFVHLWCISVMATVYRSLLKFSIFNFGNVVMSSG